MEDFSGAEAATADTTADLAPGGREVGAWARLVLAAVLVVFAIWPIVGSPFIQLVGQACVIFGIAALGQFLLMGDAGQVALSGGAFMGIGAFTTGLLSGTFLEPFPLPLLVCVAVGWVVGLLSGLPGLRFRGLYLLLASLALQFMFTSGAQEYQSNNAPAGLTVPLLHIGSLDLSAGRSLYLTVLVILALVYALCWYLDRTGIGLAWHALRESEIAAAVSGIDVVRWKLYAYAASGSITAVAGGLFAYLVGQATYQSYDLNLSISLITMVFLGGIRSRIGALAGALVITALPYILQNNLSSWMDAIGLSSGWYTNNRSEVDAGLFSLLFLLVVLFEPRGLEGLAIKAERAVRHGVTWLRGRAGKAAA